MNNATALKWGHFLQQLIAFTGVTHSMSRFKVIFRVGSWQSICTLFRYQRDNMVKGQISRFNGSIADVTDKAVTLEDPFKVDFANSYPSLDSTPACFNLTSFITIEDFPFFMLLCVVILVSLIISSGIMVTPFFTSRASFSAFLTALFNISSVFFTFSLILSLRIRFMLCLTPLRDFIFIALLILFGVFSSAYFAETIVSIFVGKIYLKFLERLFSLTFFASFNACCGLIKKFLLVQGAVSPVSFGFALAALSFMSIFVSWRLAETIKGFFVMTGSANSRGNEQGQLNSMVQWLHSYHPSYQGGSLGLAGVGSTVQAASIFPHYTINPLPMQLYASKEVQSFL